MLPSLISYIVVQISSSLRKKMFSTHLLVTMTQVTILESLTSKPRSTFLIVVFESQRTFKTLCGKGVQAVFRCTELLSFNAYSYTHKACHKISSFFNTTKYIESCVKLNTDCNTIPSCNQLPLIGTNCQPQLVTSTCVSGCF